MDWNDLRHVLAVARGGSYSSAATVLGVNATTVARRIAAIEKALDVQLFSRGDDGNIDLTQAGEVALKRAEVMEAEIGRLHEAVKAADVSASGTVRVTAMPILINWVLIPALSGLMKQYPNLRIELVADARNLNLTRREADVAIRLARPKADTGNRLVARRIGFLRYAVYVSKKVRLNADQLPWLGYDESMSFLPQAEWLSRVVKKDGRFASVTSNDGEGILQSVRAGLGRSLLPCIVAGQMPELRLLKDLTPPPEREMWLLTHPDIRNFARVDAVIRWIEATLAEYEARAAKKGEKM